MEIEKIMASLVVGIGNYRESVGKLEYCQESAREIYNILTDSEFGFCEKQYSKIIIGDSEKKINHYDIENSLKEIALLIKTEKEKERNINFSFLFFFCGHGKVSNPDGELILLMSDYSDEEKIETGLRLQDFFLKLERHLIDDVTDIAIIIDSCHSQAVSLSKKYCQSNKIGYMWSCADIDNSFQSLHFKKTFFSHYFCERIRKLDVNQAIDIKELTDYIKSKIEFCEKKQEAGCYGNQHILIAKRKRTAFMLIEHIEETIKEEVLPKRKSNVFYQIISAPPEYGKTVLMQKIKNSLECEKCICLPVTINKDYKDYNDFLNDFLFSINVSSSIDRYSDNHLFTIIDFLNKRISELEEYSVFYFLVDIEIFYIDIFNFIVNDFFPKIIAGIEYDNRIKFIIAGRFLTEKFSLVNSESRKHEIIFSKFSYTFTRNALYATIKNDKKNNDKVQNNISIAAAHLFFLSGGHPGCIAHIIQEYDSKAALFPHIFLKGHNGIDSCIKYVNSRVSSIVKNLDSIAQKHVKEFSVIRYTHIEALEFFFDFLDSDDKKKSFDSAISSSNIFNIKDEPEIDIDNITRKIIIISFQNTNFSLFISCCKKAQEIYLKILEEGENVMLSYNVILEYLFQIFQEFTFKKIKYGADIEEFQIKFFKQILPSVLNKCVDRIKDQTKNKTKFEYYLNSYSDKLKKNLQKDTELQFIINYSLMNHQRYYSETPFEKTKDAIDIFFSKQ